MIKPLKVYLDTSILNFAVSVQDVPYEKEATLNLLQQVKKGKFLAYISQVTLDEILKAGEAKRNELIKIVEQVNPEELPITEEAVALANRYIESKIIPANNRNDALHIAVATIYNLDVVVSWNFEHMVKLKTRREVPAVNALMLYKGIEICSPLEMIEP
ncbi:MAG: PIN domain-containing protein [Candidatus Omnitrophica bacterium]|nr:PIN domain-containing protein [Candidatus Omnitrophota bacterium]